MLFFWQFQYADGKGGYDIFDVNQIKNSNLFTRGKKVIDRQLSYNAKDLLRKSKKEGIVIDYVTTSQRSYLEAVFSDVTSALGGHGYKMNIEMNVETGNDGNKSVRGTAFVTLADNYKWKPELPTPLIIAGNHKDLDKLKAIGAKDYSIRVYFQIDFYYDGNKLITTPIRALNNATNLSKYPEINLGKYYTMIEGGGLINDFRFNPSEIPEEKKNDENSLNQ